MGHENLQEAGESASQAQFAILEKNERKPWQKKEWCIPPEPDAPFGCQMEEVLEICNHLGCKIVAKSVSFSL
jgi:hypothetical protein